ncbi:DinB family protein, partial [Maribacter polysiphoniae]
MRINELKSSEYDPYYKTYLDVLGNVELFETLGSQLNNFPQFISSIPDEKLNYAYDVGKWTISEVLVHILDTERVFQYRALRFMRGDETPLPGFDQDLYVPNSNAA